MCFYALQSRFADTSIAGSLQSDHHSANAKDGWGHGVPLMVIRIAHSARPCACVVPPTAALGTSAVVARRVVILVVRRETHPVVVVRVRCSIAGVLQTVAGVSAVAVHSYTILVVGLVTDREAAVLGRVPVTCRLLLHLHSQSAWLRSGQKVHFLKAEPEVGIDGPEAGSVVSPRPLPVETIAINMLMNDDPTEYRHDCCS